MTASPSVLIIGATSDIARACARRYGKAGYDVILAARATDQLGPDVQDLTVRYGVNVKTAALDIRALETHEAFLDALQPFPSTVISVVGLLGDQAVSSQDQDAARVVMETNYIGPALFLDRIANRMAAANRGTIIGISSVAGDRGRASNYTYGSAKAGFTAYLSGLRNRFAKTGVHVITVKPGFVDTKMTVGMDLPKKLTAQPDEVAEAVFMAEQRKRDVVYVRAIWLLVMTVIRLIPEPIFKRLKL